MHKRLRASSHKAIETSPIKEYGLPNRTDNAMLHPVNRRTDEVAFDTMISPRIFTETSYDLDNALNPLYLKQLERMNIQ